MDKNVGTWDSVIRAGLGLAMLGSPLAWYGLENMSGWGYAGLYPLLTALFQTCPVYAALGIGTARVAR